MIRYRKLGYIELNVSDSVRSESFYRQVVGLEYAGKRQDGAVLFRCDGDRYSLALHQAKSAGCKRVGWMLEDASQFETLHICLREHGVPYEEVPEPECKARGIGRITRMVEENTQATLEFYIADDGASGRPFQPTHTNIERLGHVVFSTPSSRKAIAFFRDVLNFRVSDSIGETVTFMRPFPNPFHHGLGISRGKRPLLHHVDFMVADIDDVGRAFNRLKSNNVQIVYGPGKHPPSGSIFLYFLDPDGMTLEYSFGMEEFPENDAREPRELPQVPESVDTWGSARDPRFATMGEMESALIGHTD
jgi:2,3-dihydroxy-p-cumate/2,3-dihydroxybenzoate 3,4-dioxygenase